VLVIKWLNFKKLDHDKNILLLPASPWKVTRNALPLKDSNEQTNFRNAFTNSGSPVAMSSPGRRKPESNTHLRVLSFVDSRMSLTSRNCHNNVNSTYGVETNSWLSKQITEENKHK
jgi:hypothetical protein